MLYTEYLNSARKHSEACKVLLNYIECNTNINTTLKKQLTITLYYLSGYIIECSVKYGIFVYLNYDKNRSVKELDINGINYQKTICKHKYRFYVDKFCQFYPGLVLLDKKKSIDKEVEQLYNNWDAEIRYFYKHPPKEIEHFSDLQFVKKFHSHAEEIMSKIIKNIL